MLEQNKAPSQESTETTSARRGFLKKAAISAPILTTIAARPVWSGQCSLSGNLSNNVSNHDHSIACEYNLYSPGGWRNGRATGVGSNADLWALYIPYNKDDALSVLLPGTSFTGSIIDALGGGNHGWERQLACAALNSILWSIGVIDCEGNPNCQIINDLAPDFYWPFTLAEVRAMYAAGPNANIYNWDAIQNID